MTDFPERISIWGERGVPSHPRQNHTVGRVMEWIKCTEEMPPYNTQILTCWPGNKRFNPVIKINERPGVNQVGHGRWWNSKPHQEPTHWMRLPSPPPTQEGE